MNAIHIQDFGWQRGFFVKSKRDHRPVPVCTNVPVDPRPETLRRIPSARIVGPAKLQCS